MEVVQRPQVNGQYERMKLLVAQSGALFLQSMFSLIVQSGGGAVVVDVGVVEAVVVVVGVVVVVDVVVVDVEGVLGPAVVVNGSGHVTSARRMS